MFIADAAANTIVRRKAAGELSVFTTIPPIENPLGDTSQVQAVPTGIVFGGNRFLVCTFTEYPYPAKKATIYHVDIGGNTFGSELMMPRLIEYRIYYQVIPRTHLEEGNSPLRHIIASVANFLTNKDDYDY